MDHEIIMAGFGGQGIMLIGTLLTYAGKEEGKAVSWLPSYGPEMRGGTANCSGMRISGHDSFAGRRRAHRGHSHEQTVLREVQEYGSAGRRSDS